MKLEMGHIFINDIQFGEVSKIENGVLYVAEEAVREIVLEDEKIKSVSFDIARPGESVRITPVKDVIEPRCKVEGKGLHPKGKRQKPYLACQRSLAAE